ncbi:hypothetical protein M9H77_04475 [Catharanthus roseus]|uniref:Uncharacterized protein n=1 Tax=Catharanthus roseus TaxID=4058 RepID=A0ACC0CEH7_CATRO|nr:hypothetical protein M9H77_04475 [Catharanthus roseus]
MASVESANGGEAEDIERGDHLALEMVPSSNVAGAELSSSSDDSISVSEDQITPLLAQSQRPKVNIFSPSFYKRKPVKEQISRLAQTETSPVLQFTLWAWGGSRYSGFLCVALSSIIYCIMEVVSDIFSAQSIPLHEVAFTRCTIILILSFLWLRRTGQPLFGPSSVRKLLVLRALSGYFSLFAFVYCIQTIPLSQGIILSFTTPIMASVAARIILHEKLRIAEVGGLACSFFGVLFIFRPLLNTQGESSNSHAKGGYHVYAFLVGLFSSVVGGICYCFMRAGAKASDQAVLTVFSFGLLASPAAAISMLALEDFVLPSFYTLLLMVLLGSLAFFAEITLARGLQLEKTSKISNIQYLEAAISQLAGMSFSRIVPTFGRLVGSLLILISVCCTIYIGPEKEIE